MPLPFSGKYFVPIIYCVICWIVVLVDFFLPDHDELAKEYGITPRKMKGLVGILVSPFLNDGVFWMITNTVGILIFGWLLLRRRVYDFILVTVVCIPLSGILCWVVNPQYSVGSGGLICAWFGYLVAIPIFERPIKLGALAVAVATAAVNTYIVILFILPGTNSIGLWIYNFAGFFSGVLVSVLKHRVFRRTSQHWESLISTDSATSSQPDDKTRLLDTPVANKPFTAPPTNSNPFE